MNPLKFPQDGGPHNCVVEWWYYNGWLEAEDGRQFAYMMCLFKVDNKRVSIPFLSRIPIKTVYFAHSLLTDINAKDFKDDVEYFSVISRDSFKRPLMYVNFTNPISIRGGYVNSVIEEFENNSYHLKRENFDLKLISTKQPLLEGGTGYLQLHDKTTYYYSYTNLQTTGLVFVNGEPIKVKGKSWMDHQWADTSFDKDTWTWFSLQLDNNIELVCYEYGKGDKKDFLASILYADGHSEHTNNIKITPLGEEWESEKTKAKYHIEWKIEIPEKQMEFVVRPPVKTQEMIFSVINYWEGPLEVVGKIKEETVRGQGFMELVGRQAKYGNLGRMARDAFKKIKKYGSILKV